LQLDTRLTSLLAFIYTYHYLNWFIKAEVIRWNEHEQGPARACCGSEHRFDRSLFL
jgi:hypothetical protein